MNKPDPLVQVGERVTVFEAGDRVVVDPNIPCRMCTACREPKPHLCANPCMPSIAPESNRGNRH